MPAQILPSLSMFFPCYNEADNLEVLLTQARQVCAQVAKTFEIIVVDDGSTDQTAAIGKQFAQQAPEVRVVSQKNTGYGGALKTGLAACKYDWIFFADSDLQFDLRELAKFMPLHAEFDLIIGYREKRADPFMRKVNAQLLRVWAWLFFGLPFKIRDINCAFKLMRTSAIRPCLPLLCNGAMVTTELLLKAHRQGLRIEQIPVTHFPRVRGTQTGAKLAVIGKAIRETALLREALLAHQRS